MSSPTAAAAAVLDARSLMAQAAADAGLDDYGNTDFVEPLSRFVEAVSQEAALGPMALAGFGAGIVDRLKNRLRFHDDLKKHPAILDEDVSDPIIITGLARTGTTKLQRVLAADPQTQALRMWQGQNPAPLPGTQGVQPDPRIALAQANADALRQASADFTKAHSLQAEDPEEDVWLLQKTFECVSDTYFYRSPSYLSWLSGRPLNRAYAGLRGLLQYLQWQDGGRRGRPWVLKNPTHLGRLDEVLSTFPKATVIHCHRNPAVAIPSLCRLVEAVRQAVGSERVDPLEIGATFAAHCGAQWERQLEQLSRLRSRTHIIDVHYEQISNDVINVVRDIYDCRGLVLPPAAALQMAEWERHNPQHRDGKNLYSLERYGLSERSIAQSFESYFDYFPSALSH